MVFPGSIASFMALLVCSGDREHHPSVEDGHGEAGWQGFKTKYANRDGDGKTVGHIGSRGLYVRDGLFFFLVCTIIGSLDQFSQDFISKQEVARHSDSRSTHMGYSDNSKTTEQSEACTKFGVIFTNRAGRDRGVI